MGEIVLKDLKPLFKSYFSQVCFKQKATSTDWFLCGFPPKRCWFGSSSQEPKP